MTKHEKHPRITAMRALNLLLNLSDRGVNRDLAIEQVERALRHHIEAELTKKRPRRKR